MVLLGHSAVLSLSCLQKPHTEKGIAPKDLWVWPLSNGVGSCEIHRKVMKILRELYIQNHHQLGLKGTMQYQIKRGLRTLKILLAGSSLRI